METTVNERIAQIISQCGYKSKRSFAEKIGVAQTSLNDILRGAEPKYSTLYKIKDAQIRERDIEIRREIIAAMIGDASHKDFIKRVNSIYNWIKEGKV